MKCYDKSNNNQETNNKFNVNWKLLDKERFCIHKKHSF